MFVATDKAIDELADKIAEKVADKVAVKLSDKIKGDSLPDIGPAELAVCLSTIVIIPALYFFVVSRLQKQQQN